MFLVNQNGRILHANVAGHSMISEGDILSAVGSRLFLHEHAATARATQTCSQAAGLFSILPCSKAKSTSVSECGAANSVRCSVYIQRAAPPRFRSLEPAAALGRHGTSFASGIGKSHTADTMPSAGINAVQRCLLVVRSDPDPCAK
jgi:hypothetical protein